MIEGFLAGVVVTLGIITILVGLFDMKTITTKIIYCSVGGFSIFIALGLLIG